MIEGKYRNKVRMSGKKLFSNVKPVISFRQERWCGIVVKFRFECRF